MYGPHALQSDSFDRFVCASIYFYAPCGKDCMRLSCVSDLPLLFVCSLTLKSLSGEQKVSVGHKGDSLLDHVSRCCGLREGWPADGPVKKASNFSFVTAHVFSRAQSAQPRRPAKGGAVQRHASLGLRVIQRAKRNGYRVGSSQSAAYAAGLALQVQRTWAVGNRHGAGRARPVAVQISNRLGCRFCHANLPSWRGQPQYPCHIERERIQRGTQ